MRAMGLHPAPLLSATCVTRDKHNNDVCQEFQRMEGFAELGLAPKELGANIRVPKNKV
jgi:hypothetical protein